MNQTTGPALSLIEGHSDKMTKGESDHLSFVWMRCILLEQLQKCTSADRMEDVTIGMDTGAADHYMMDRPGAITAKNEVPDSPRHMLYASGRSVSQYRQVGVFTKGKCAVIAPSENESGSPKSKPYPVSGSGVAGREVVTVTGRCPDFQKEFDLYKAGRLELNFLYTLFGKNLGTFFNELFMDILPVLWADGI